MLVIIRSFEHWCAELEGAILPVQVISDHKALEVFMTTKALTARQACWADTLSCFNFWIVYSPGQTNQVDTLTCRGQDNIDCTDWQQQALLQPDQLDECICTELNITAIDTEVSNRLLLINDLLTANHTAPEIQEYRQRISEDQSKWTESNRLTLYNRRLIVPEIGFLWTRIIQEAHSTILTAHPGKNKTYKIIGQCYWWPKMTDNIDQFIANCEMC
jgi:hypothetical protein